MIAYEEARRLVIRHARPLAPVGVPAADACGLYLAEDLCATGDLPGFDQSAMDGYAVRVADVAAASEGAPVRLRLRGEVFAGDAAAPTLGAGEAVRVLTGAMLPAGTEAVVMQEDCTREGAGLLVRRAVALGAHTRRRGEECRRGDVVLPVGTRIGPAAVGVMASHGHDTVRVHRPPRVSVIATGSEIVGPGEPLAPGRVRDSNTPALCAALRLLGIREISATRVADDRDALRHALAEALAGCDVVLVSGGVSVGDRDYAPETLAELGVRTVFHGVAMRPGKPAYLGLGPPAKAGAPALAFGLPGNPVAALVVLHQLAKPGLLRLMGAANPTPLRLTAKLGADLAKSPGRLEWVRAAVGPYGDGWVAMPTLGQESHMLSGLARADALIEFPAEATEMRAGDEVCVERLAWGE
jgi:molybdopterin molybdotransferase